MKWFHASLGALALAAACTGSAQQDETKTQRGLGLTAGVFFPADRALRDVFGDTWASFGIQPITFGAPRNWRISGGITVLKGNRGPNRVLAIPATLGVTRDFPSGGDAVPFVAVAGGPAYYDYSIQTGATTVSTRRIGWNANVRAGVTFSQRFQLQARYDFYSPTDGLRFDGLTLSLAYQAFRF